MPVSGETIFMTGGTGFIGSALTRRLVADNKVIAYDNNYRGVSEPIQHPNLTVVSGDVLDAHAVKKSVQGATIIIHLASIAGVDTVLRMPVTTMKVALLGTFNMLEAAREERALKRFVDFSTSEVFGSYAYNVREGDLTPMGAVGTARWTYAVSKLASEHLAHNYHVQYGVPALSVRPFNIYGPGQVGEGAIHRFVVRALAGEDLEVHNDGGQIRAWCYIDDIVDGILRCLELPDAIGHAFNIGNPRSIITVHELARLILRLSGSSSKIRFVKKDMVDVELRIPNIDKARQLLGFEPTVDLDEGLLRTLKWYRERRAA